MLYSVLISTALFAIVATSSMVSLDLGTEFMKIGIVKPGVPIDIVLNTETKRKTPMAVFIKDEERLFGDAALSQGQKQPSHVYSHLLDLLGKSVDSLVVEEYKKRFPYHIIEADPSRKTVVFRHSDSTFFSVEELLAMQVENAVVMAGIHGGTPVDKAVICVPAFFNQKEREAVQSVADIAGVQLMQLMSTTSAIALQYAVFRNVQMTEKPSIVLFATVGSQFTSAAVVSYSLQKDKTTKEKVPTVQVLGVGYDRSLGGFEMDIRIRELLADKFTEKYPKLTDIRTNARAMQKLVKEAKKVKTVLSANTETWAQVESIHQDKDFRAKVSRTEIEGLFSDLFPRFRAPFEEAIKSADITKDEIELVVPFGGASRIPKIQEQILSVTQKKELHKYINSDEAAAMGSAFLAASTSSVFRTKEIKLKDANQFPFFVAFNKLSLDEEGGVLEERLINKELYHRNNAYPQKKAMTYTKFNADFHFNISYGVMDFLTDAQQREFGSLPLMHVTVKGVQDVFNLHHDKQPKGIKAHIMVDESGLIRVDSVEAVFETIVPELNNTQSGWMDSVSNFFSGTGEEEVDGEKTKESDDKKEDPVKKTSEEPNNTEIPTNANQTESESIKKEIVPEKPQTIKELLTVETVHLGTPKLSDTTASKEKLSALTKIDVLKRATEEARNHLETFVIHMKDVLESDLYKSACTVDECTKIQDVLQIESDWLEEESWGESLEVFNQRLASIEDYCDPLVSRVKELEGRPSAIADLKQAFNLTEQFLSKIANTTEQLRYHTAVELEKLGTMLTETKDWLKTARFSQDALAAHTDPVLKVATMTEKKAALERELYYLVKKPIPQWYRDKVAKMMELLKKQPANSTNTDKSNTTADTDKTTDKTAENTEDAEKENTDSDNTDKTVDLNSEDLGKESTVDSIELGDSQESIAENLEKSSDHKNDEL